MYHPLKEVAVLLWKKYNELMEDCHSFKLLHTPTDEIGVYTTIQDPQRASMEDLAIAFAIYFAACAAMPDAFADTALRQDRVQAIINFKTGFEQAMAHSNFLESPTAHTIRALAIYMVSTIY